MKIMITKDRNVLNTKFLTQFANALSRAGHEVNIVCDSYKKPGYGEQIDNSIEFTNLSALPQNPLGKLYVMARKHLTLPSFRFRRLINQRSPDIIICYFLIDLFNVRFLQKTKPPVVLMIHNYPPVIFDKLKKRSWFKRKIYKRLIEEADAIQVLNKSFEKTVSHYYNVGLITTIGNAVEQIPANERANLDKPKKKIIYVGRIAKEGKRQHILIEAFAKIAKRFPDWRVEFWGLEKYPSYNQELRELIKKYSLEDQVFLRGYSKNIHEEYRNADINAFPSLHEGFGLGLADGMAMGLPSIGFNYAPSVNELIKDGMNGFLVRDVDDFSEKLEELMSNKELRKRLGDQAAEDMQQYEPNCIHAKWTVFLELVCERTKR